MTGARKKFIARHAKPGDKVVFKEDLKSQFPMAFKFRGGKGMVVVEKLFEDEGAPTDAIVKASQLECMEAYA